MMTKLEELRLQDPPTLPLSLQDLAKLTVRSEMIGKGSEEVAKLFPLTSQQPVISFFPGNRDPYAPKKVGVVFSGGQAPGGHNVIAGLFDALQKMHRDSSVIGFLNGPEGIVKNHSKILTKEIIASYRNLGGFDLIGSGRTKIETEEQFQAAEKTVRDLALDGLVIIGGDDSNTNAAFLAEYFLAHKCSTRVIGVPKTIDGDLKGGEIACSFGFDSASKTYSEIIGNLLRDSLSAKKYTFFIKLMGRSASHIALECAFQTHPNLTLIGEEIEALGWTLSDVTNHLCDLIEARSAQGKDYGVILIPEGIIEFIPEVKTMIQELNTLLAKEPFALEKLTPPSQHCFSLIPEAIQSQLLMERDPHGNVQVSKIETERLLMELVQKELKKRNFKGKFSPVPHFCGYEGRSCLPSRFDANYCYALGYAVALLIANNATGYIATIKQLQRPLAEWQVGGFPLPRLIQMEMRKGKLKPVIHKALVDLQGAPFQYFQRERESWRLNDDYRYPGPIQFYGPAELTEAITETLALENA